MSLFSLSWDSSFEPNSYDSNAHISKLMDAYRQLPRHIARKHLMAAMRRTIKDGVPLLRQNTPPLGTRRGRRKKGEARTSTGQMRAAVTTRAGQSGNNSSYGAFVWAVLGYRYGPASMKAIFLERGTSHGIRGYGMVEKTMQQYGPISAQRLATEMALALEKATNELGGGKNPGYGG